MELKSQQKKTLLELGAGDYQLTVTDANDCNTEIASVIIPVLGTLEVIVPQNISWCFTEDLQLIETISVEAQSIEWTNPPSTDVLSTTNSVFFQEEPGVYELVITGIDGPCVVTDTVEVTIHELPQSDAGEDQDAELEDEVILGGNPTTDDLNTVVWAPFELLNESSLFPQSFGYQYMAYSNCLPIIVTTPPVPDTVVVPNFITPNSDNINDEFIIRFVEDYEDLSRVNIFNRWGDRVWQSEPLYDNSTPWRGTNQNGAKLADGVYFYTIELLNVADNYEYNKLCSCFCFRVVRSAITSNYSVHAE